MKLYDANTEQEYSLLDLRNDWKEFREEDPENHADNFKTELFEILMATVNGRNDCTVIGMTAREISNYIVKMRRGI